MRGAGRKERSVDCQQHFRLARAFRPADWLRVGYMDEVKMEGKHLDLSKLVGRCES